MTKHQSPPKRAETISKAIQRQEEITAPPSDNAREGVNISIKISKPPMVKVSARQTQRPSRATRGERDDMYLGSEGAISCSHLSAQAAKSGKGAYVRYFMATKPWPSL